MKRMIGNELSNPLIASWITSYIISVIGELLHYTSKLNGKVVSATNKVNLTLLNQLSY